MDQDLEKYLNAMWEKNPYPTYEYATLLSKLLIAMSYLAKNGINRVASTLGIFLSHFDM